MNESHPLATDESANKIFSQWREYYDLSCRYLVEKSPPNIIRTRYLQKLFPNSKFVVILRHPIAVSYATQKWSGTSIESLIEHALLAYEVFLGDMKYIDHVYVLRYEEFVCEPQKTMDSIYEFLGLGSVTIHQKILKDVNDKYFAMWANRHKSLLDRLFHRKTHNLESRINKFGYDMNDPDKLTAVSWLGPHNNANRI